MSGVGNQLGGQLLNMLSNDATRIEFSVYFVPYLVVGPLEAIATAILLTKMIDVSVLSGLVIIAIAIPTQAALGKVLDKIR